MFHVREAILAQFAKQGSLHSSLVIDQAVTMAEMDFVEITMEERPHVAVPSVQEQALMFVRDCLSVSTNSSETINEICEALRLWLVSGTRPSADHIDEILAAMDGQVDPEELEEDYPDMYRFYMQYHQTSIDLAARGYPALPGVYGQLTVHGFAPPGYQEDTSSGNTPSNWSASEASSWRSEWQPVVTGDRIATPS